METFTIDGPRIELPQVRNGIQLFAPIGNIWLRSGSNAWLEKSYSVSAADLATANLIVTHSTIETRQVDGDKTLISMHPPQDCPFEALAADSVLSIPARLDIDLRTTLGLIDMRSYTARNATLRTRDGNLVIGAVEGKLEFSSESGRVELAGNVLDAKGSTTTGPIIVSKVPPGASYEFETRSASCTVRVPAVASIEVIHRTRTGVLRVDFEDRTSERRFVPLADGWNERTIRFAGAPGIARKSTIVFRSEEGNLDLTRPTPPRIPTPDPTAASR
ncbi:MAG: hypothetical protein H6832_03500 [Planctomycetes bacterium]|nr:hypothetical protein [Planctomycetota bacterium]